MEINEKLVNQIKEVVIYTQQPIRNELIDIIYGLSKIHIEVPGS